jgi:UDP-N-acetylmuramoyl-L-alanyl-D-glutamate--2,6-diaminopimelate ligase
MRLAELIAGLPIEGAPAADVEALGVTHDSRRVTTGDLFVALAGSRHDGRVFAAQAIERGAVAVLAAGPPPSGSEPLPAGIPWLVAAEPRALLGVLAARAYAHPDQELVMAGVTGTNGKSTVAALIALIFEAAGHSAGIIGTLGYRLGERRFDGDRTTPEASDLFRILRLMRTAGAEAVAMEVSSHALALGRVTAAGFDVALFLNLTRDHLDFHPDLESYFAAKRKLFGLLRPGGKAVVNRDDAWGRRLIAELPGCLTFGRGGDVSVRSAELEVSGTRAVLATPRGELAVASPLIGRYNLDNLLAAAAAAEALALPHAAVAAAFAAAAPLPGRLEPVDCGQAFPVFVDYAHTDAALAAALRSVRELTHARVVLVFGCGGDRDPGKRALMGRVAGELADLPIVTSDNPRGEDPLTIIAAVEEGLKASGNPAYRVVPDRREAIRRAVAVAGPDAVLLVAGKGHERVQIVGDRELPFSDREEIVRALEEKLGSKAHR